MKSVKIILSFVLICLIFISCAAENKKGEDTTAKAQNDIDEETETGIERPVIPEGTSYKGYEFKILIPSIYVSEYEYIEADIEQERGEPLADSVYRRNRLVESLLDIQIKAVAATADHLGMAEYIRKIILSDSDEFDAICTTNRTPNVLFREKYLVNLFNIPNLDLSKPWWDQRMVEDMAYKKSRIYHICGDIQYFDKYGICVLLFNKNLCLESGLEYPYDKVRNDTWTFAEFSKYVKGFSRDLNGDGVMDENDLWGIVENAGAIVHFLPSCGEKIATLNSDGIPVINALTERHINVVKTLCETLSDKTITLFADADQLRHLKDPYVDGVFKVFRDGHALFSPVSTLGGIQDFRNMEDDFGYLPYPKFDEVQKEYFHFQSYGWSSSYSVPVTNKNLDRTGMILEVMAGYSTDLLIPALIDVSLKSKFACDTDSEEMLEIIFKTKTYDLAIEFWIGDFQSVYYQAAHNGFSKFVSSIEAQMARAEADMANLISVYEELK